jgi:hypothetical protein
MTYQERRHIPPACERTPESVSREKNERLKMLAPDARKLHTQQYQTTEHLGKGLPLTDKMEYIERQANRNSTIYLHLQKIRIKLEVDKSHSYMPNKGTNIQDNKNGGILYSHQEEQNAETPMLK